MTVFLEVTSPNYVRGSIECAFDLDPRLDPKIDIATRLRRRDRLMEELPFEALMH